MTVSSASTWTPQRPPTTPHHPSRSILLEQIQLITIPASSMSPPRLSSASPQDPRIRLLRTTITPQTSQNNTLKLSAPKLPHSPLNSQRASPATFIIGPPFIRSIIPTGVMCLRTGVPGGGGGQKDGYQDGGIQERKGECSWSEQMKTRGL
jgi:hypothetical protein